VDKLAPAVPSRAVCRPLFNSMRLEGLPDSARLLQQDRALNKAPARRPVLHNNHQEAPLVDEPSDDASARAINAQAWEPPPGMVKRQCRYWFAASPHSSEECCPDCASIGQRSARIVMLARNQ